MHFASCWLNVYIYIYITKNKKLKRIKNNHHTLAAPSPFPVGTRGTARKVFEVTWEMCTRTFAHVCVQALDQANPWFFVSFFFATDQATAMYLIEPMLERHAQERKTDAHAREREMELMQNITNAAISCRFGDKNQSAASWKSPNLSISWKANSDWSASSWQKSNENPIMFSPNPATSWEAQSDWLASSWETNSDNQWVWKKGYWDTDNQWDWQKRDWEEDTWAVHTWDVEFSEGDKKARNIVPKKIWDCLKENDQELIDREGNRRRQQNKRHRRSERKMTNQEQEGCDKDDKKITLKEAKQVRKEKKSSRHDDKNNRRQERETSRYKERSSSRNWRSARCHSSDS